MKRNFFVIANPGSGIRNVEAVLRELNDYFVSKKFKFEIFLTAKSRDGWRTVEKYFTEDYTDLIILGGDGTINEAINGLRHDRPVSIIPTGSGNDFVKNLDLGHTLEDHIQVIDHGKIIEVDVGICNGRKFLNGVGIGFDGQIVANMQGQRTFLRGPARYYYHVLRILATFRARSFSYKIDQQKLKKDLILLCVANGSTFGGSFRLTPNADIQDGKLEICEIGKISAIRRFLNIHRLQAGTLDRLRAVSYHQAETVHIAKNPKLFAHIDGEPLGNPPFDISIQPKGLKVRVRK